VVLIEAPWTVRGGHGASFRQPLGELRQLAPHLLQLDDAPEAAAEPGVGHAEALEVAVDPKAHHQHAPTRQQVWPRPSRLNIYGHEPTLHRQISVNAAQNDRRNDRRTPEPAQGRRLRRCQRQAVHDPDPLHGGDLQNGDGGRGVAAAVGLPLRVDAMHTTS
jgi:hypothetical protein